MSPNMCYLCHQSIQKGAGGIFKQYGIPSAITYGDRKFMLGTEPNVNFSSISGRFDKAACFGCGFVGAGSVTNAK